MGERGVDFPFSKAFTPTLECFANSTEPWIKIGILRSKASFRFRMRFLKTFEPCLPPLPYLFLVVGYRVCSLGITLRPVSPACLFRSQVRIPSRRSTCGP